MYFQAGQNYALVKLGMVIPAHYASTHSREFDMGNANKKQEFWKNFDDHPTDTGEESSAGMPSSPKTGSTKDYGYGESPAFTPIGGYDADQHRSDRDQRLSSAMEQAFRANEEYDQSYAPESPSTQPHGPKMANAFAAPRAIAAPRAGGSMSRTMGSVPRLGTNPSPRTQGMSFTPPQANTFKPPTNLSPATRIQRAGQADARATVSSAHPGAIGAVGSSRVPAVPTMPGGAPVNPVNTPPNLTITAPPQQGPRL